MYNTDSPSREAPRSDNANCIVRRIASVCGRVQGVGFRPFIHRLAARHALAGCVRNVCGSVHIDVEGTPDALDAFAAFLISDPPAMAHIDSVVWRDETAQGTLGFKIAASNSEKSPENFVSPDFATCAECLSEIVDPANRRYRYPFTTCMNCGPRLSVIQALPYDRSRTTMALFPMCADCRAEYENPEDRRFGAELIACAACGPQLSLLDPSGTPIETTEPIQQTATAILSGAIVAVKGLGGFHLVCDARNENAVVALRARKHRDEKPFAIMMVDLDTIARHCNVGETEASLLQAPDHPIVLLKRRADSELAASIAPENPSLGVMLPCTPLHHLLMDAVGNVPLVATSGNASDSPIVFENREAVEQLGCMVDLLLVHNRNIHLRSDDSVVRIVRDVTLPIRRSRGFSPATIPLPQALRVPVLALGGHMKSTFALGRDARAILSHHLGDLDELSALEAYIDSIRHYEELFHFRPELLVHDLHPDYASTRYAMKRSEDEGIPCLAVQHHHAHIASVMAENGLNGPVIGVSFDGTGYGPDGTVWGGEILVADYDGFERVFHLRQVPMPGGERVVRDPWRMALAHLNDSGENLNALLPAVSPNQIRGVRSLISSGTNAPLTSSCGRLFDAVAAMTGLCTRTSFEGQAAIRLECAASACRHAQDRVYPVPLSGKEIDTRPLIAGVARDIRDGVPPAVIARRFHNSLVEVTRQTCAATRSRFGRIDVVLSGGVFMNAILLEEVVTRLSVDGFNVYQHSVVPPNDGGLCLGQLAIAAAWTGRSDYVPCDSRTNR